MSSETKRALTHPLTIQVAWTVFMWVIALIAMSLTVFAVWFIVSTVGWALFVAYKMRIEARLDSEHTT